jgi:hypothetical protein
MSKRRGCTNEATTGIAYLLVAISDEVHPFDEQKKPTELQEHTLNGYGT